MKKEGQSKPFPWHLAVLLLFNTLFLFGFYCYLVMKLDVNWIFWVYYGLLAASGLAYVIINRGFALDSLTHASLSSEWSEEKKTAFLSARDERKRKSRWLLTIIFPLCLTVLFDILYLFFGEHIAKTLYSVMKLLGGL